jgi:hypothetical protein
LVLEGLSKLLKILQDSPEAFFVDVYLRETISCVCDLEHVEGVRQPFAKLYHQGLRVLVFFEERNNILDEYFESALIAEFFDITEPTQGIRYEVEKHFGVLLVHLVKKLFDQRLNFRVRVLEKQSNIAHVTLDLDHIVERQMGDDGEGGLPDPRILLVEVHVQVAVVGLDDVGKSVEKVAH